MLRRAFAAAAVPLQKDGPIAFLLDQEACYCACCPAVKVPTTSMVQPLHVTLLVP